MIQAFGRKENYMNRRALTTLIIAVAIGLAVCSCRRAELQTISDVANPQRLVFRAPMSAPTAVDIQVVGHLDGSATLTSIEIPELQKAQWPASPLSGDVDCRIRQVWSAQTCTLEYTPTNVRTGSLSVKLSWR